MRKRPSEVDRQTYVRVKGAISAEKIRKNNDQRVSRLPVEKSTKQKKRRNPLATTLSVDFGYDRTYCHPARAYWNLQCIQLGRVTGAPYQLHNYGDDAGRPITIECLMTVGSEGRDRLPTNPTMIFRFNHNALNGGGC